VQHWPVALHTPVAPPVIVHGVLIAAGVETHENVVISVVVSSVPVHAAVKHGPCGVQVSPGQHPPTAAKYPSFG
jgi:hypothetical protein